MGMSKGLLIILDGLGDRPVPALGWQTPLGAARAPNFDRLAMAGITGLIHPLAPGVPVGTQVGVGLLFGVARADLPGLSRGPIEAAGVGMVLRDGDVTFRCNFATLHPNGDGFAIIDRRAGRISCGADELAEALSGMDLGDGVSTRFCASTQHRGVLLLRGEGLSDAVTDTDPGAGHCDDGLLVCRARMSTDSLATRTAGLVNAFLRRSNEVLSDHPVNVRREQNGLLPANGILTRGSGRIAPLRNLIKHLGLRTAVIAEEGTILGLGRLFGFDVLNEPGFTALPDTDLDAMVAATGQAIKDHDLVFLHIKGSDTLAHDRNPAGKKAFIEKIDAALAPLLDGDLVIGITGDHTTDSNVGRHTGDPVPALLHAPLGRLDSVAAFSESACMSGGLGHISSTAFLCTLLDHMDAMHNHRAYEYIYY